MLTALVMVTGPKSPVSRTSISPPAMVWASAAANVRQGDERVHGLESLPDAAETQVRPDCNSVPLIKLAETLCAEFIVTEQPPVPVQAPVQPLKFQPWAGNGVRATAVPLV